MNDAHRTWLLRRLEGALPVATAETLAVFRVVLGVALLFSGELHAAPRYAALPPALRVAPDGLAWLATLPFGPLHANALRAIAVAAAVMTILGLYTRVATLLLSAASFLLLAMGQLGGAVTHNMHLVWLAVVLAASPAGAGWSIDAWSARAAVEPSPSFGVPVASARALLACVYFFPGLHKLLTQGLGWASVENLSLQLHWKWLEWNEVPSFRLDQHPTLLTGGGYATLAFELSFPALVFFRRTRPAAALGAVAFHLATDRMMHIAFSSLWVLAPLLLDWPRPWRLGGEAPKEQAGGALRKTASSLVVGLALVVGAGAAGIRGKMHAFPFACYPTFAPRPPAVAPDLRIVVRDAAGAALELRHARDAAGHRTQAEWGLVWALAGATAPIDPTRLTAYVNALAKAQPGPFATAAAVEIDRVELAVSPDARDAPPVSATRLLTLPAAALGRPHSTP